MEDLNSGILWVSSSGKVKFANKQATQRTGLQAGSTVYEPELLHNIKLAVLREPTAAVQVIGMPSDFGKPAPVLQCSTFAGFSKDDAFVFVEPEPNHNRKIAYENLMQVLKHDLAEPTTHICNKIVELKRNIPNQHKQLDAVLASLVEVLDLLDSIHKLADVWVDNKLVDSERLELWQLVQQAWEFAKPTAQRRGIVASFKSTTPTSELPTIYGSKFWLHKALLECLQVAVRSSKDHANIVVEHKQLGPRAVISIHNSSGFDHANLTTKLLGGETKSTRQNFIGLELAEHILNIHGGLLRANLQENQFVLDIPTGAPAAVLGQQLDIQQAQRYAEDLAQLMARSRKEKKLKQTYETKSI